MKALLKSTRLRFFPEVYLLVIFHIFSMIQCNASSLGIIVDHPSGSNQTLIGPAYQIHAELGKTKGTNLFHSFYQFNVHEGEKAVFHASDQITSIISRVTGPDHSWIDGGIQSTASNADIYFFNPNGIVFGPNAWLDIPQSFHVSTCDYMTFTDQLAFDATHSSPILSSAPPESFGFIDADIAPILISGKGHVDADNQNNLSPILYLSDSQTLSLIAGDIIMDNGTFNIAKGFPVPLLDANQGQINIISLASAGAVKLLPDHLDISSFDQLGNIQISQHSAISASSGKILIHANELQMNESYINAGQYTEDFVHVGGFAGGNIDIQVNELRLWNGSGIFLETFGKDSGGDINIFAQNIYMGGDDDSDNKERSIITTNSIMLDESLSQQSGDAGNIYLNAHNLYLSHGARIEANSLSNGNGGKIDLDIANLFKLTGDLSDTNYCGVMAVSIHDGPDGGKAGDIHIRAKNIEIENNALIISSTSSTGDGGQIGIDVEETLSISGGDLIYDPETDIHSQRLAGIFSTTLSWDVDDSGNIQNSDQTLKVGDSGKIFLSGQTLKMDHLAHINASSDSTGNAGEVYLDFKTIEISDHSGVFSQSFQDADSGLILIESEKIVLGSHGKISVESKGKGKPGGVLIDTVSLEMNHAEISSTATSKESTADGLGVIIGQEIELEGEDVRVGGLSEEVLMDHSSEINTSTKGKGNAGSILIFSDRIQLDNHAMIASASLLKGPSGHSGEILLTADTVSLDNGSGITTENAGEGKAGLIRIDTRQFAMNHASRIYSNNTYNPDGGTAGLILISNGLAGGTLLTDVSPENLSEIPVIIPSEHISIQNNSSLNTSSESKNGAGGIVIRSKNLMLNAYASISAENNCPGDSEHFGIISIESDRIQLSGQSWLSTQSKGEGDAGGISLEVGALKLLDSSYITSAGVHPKRDGAGGHIFIAKSFANIDKHIFGSLEIDDAATAYALIKPLAPVDTMYLSQSSFISTSSAGSGDAGGIMIDAQNIHLIQNSRISSESTSPTNGGTAGHIKIDQFTQLTLTGKSYISTQAVNSSEPDIMLPDRHEVDRLNGLIIVSGQGQLYLHDAGITSSVLGGLGNGGNLEISANEILMNDAKIIANAYEGNGGNIDIVSDYLIKSSDSVIEASSRLGVDGEISISAFSENFDQALLQLPNTFLNASKWLKTPCAYRGTDDISRFIICGIDAHPTDYEDWLPAR